MRCISSMPAGMPAGTCPRGKQASCPTQSFTKRIQSLTEKANLCFARSTILISQCNSVCTLSNSVSSSTASLRALHQAAGARQTLAIAVSMSSRYKSFRRRSSRTDRPAECRGQDQAVEVHTLPSTSGGCCWPRSRSARSWCGRYSRGARSRASSGTGRPGRGWGDVITALHFDPDGRLSFTWLRGPDRVAVSERQSIPSAAAQ